MLTLALCTCTGDHRTPASTLSWLACATVPAHRQRDWVDPVPVGMGESVKQALKEAERAAKKQKLCVDVSASGISSTLRNLVAARAQVSDYMYLQHVIMPVRRASR